MTVTRNMTMANDRESPGARPTMGWPIAIFIGTLGLLGGFAGYNHGAAEDGLPTLAPWAGVLIPLTIGMLAMAIYLWRRGAFWRDWSPRKRLYWASLAIAGGIGGLAAVMLTLGQKGAANALTLDGPIDPIVAVAVAMAWVVGLAVSLLAYHRSVDDHEREAYHLGTLAGFYAFVIPCPMWWVLDRADLAPPVMAMPLFLFSIGVNAVVYLWFKFR